MELELIKRTDDIAIYATFIHGAHNSYEVHIIRKVKQASREFRDSTGKTHIIKTEAGEKLAASSDFGRYAWSFADKDRATKCFDGLVEKLK